MVTLPAPAGAGPLRTGIVDPGNFSSPGKDQAFSRTRDAGASVARLILAWRNVAPDVPPAGFEPTNPADPAYDWSGFDAQVRAAVAQELSPLVTVQVAPAWAETPAGGPPGTNRPDAAAFGAFAAAAATRYNGSFVPPGETSALPRVRFWQAWNEPNRDYFLMPQFQGRVVVSGRIYRQLVNAFADAVRGVNPTNVVVAGGLAPLGRTGKPAPIRFMKAFLAAPAKFDVWSHHPYTSGGPTHKAAGSGNVTLGSLPKMRKLLTQFVRSGRVKSRGKVRFWVTEFSWDTKPPDPKALPMNLHARWTAEALYRMWRQNITLVTWYRIQDDPLKGPFGTPYQSGFYTVKGAPKKSLRAFRFPFVALRQPDRIRVWGRTPTSRPGRVVIQIRAGGGWRQLTTVRANSAGIFTRVVRTPYRSGVLRARYKGKVSLGFSLTPVENRWVNPFGCGGPIRC